MCIKAGLRRVFSFRNTSIITVGIVLIIMLSACSDDVTEADRQREHEYRMAQLQANSDVEVARLQQQPAGLPQQAIQPMPNACYDQYAQPVACTSTVPRFDQNGTPVGNTDSNIVPSLIAGALVGYVASEFIDEIGDMRHKSIGGKNYYYDKYGKSISDAEYYRRKAQSERARADWLQRENARRSAYMKSNPTKVVSMAEINKRRDQQKQMLAARTKMQVGKNASYGSMLKQNQVQKPALNTMKPTLNTSKAIFTPKPASKSVFRSSSSSRRGRK